MTVRPTREEAVLALAGFGWVTVGLWGLPVACLVVGVLAAAGLSVSRRRPRVAAGLVFAGSLLATFLGVPSENPATVLPVAVVVYGLGRWAGWWAAGLGLVAFLGSARSADPLVGTLVFCMLLYGCLWGFGRMVAAKTNRAAAAQQRAARVGGQDPRAVADAVVAEERARLAGDIAGLVGDAVEAMCVDAALAQQQLDPAVIERIRMRGAVVVTELRRMLGLLRQPPETQPPEGRPTRSSRRSWRSFVLPGAALATGAVGMAAGWPQASAAVLVPLGLLPLVLLLPGTRLSLALVLSAGAIGVAALIEPTALGAGPIVAIIVLSWRAGLDGRRAVWGCWLLLIAVSTIAAILADPANVALQLVMFVLPAWAGHAWGESDRDQRVAQQATTQAQSALDRAVAEAVRQERLRVARDLHDVTSHALGVMVLQAGAASAQRVRDPSRARASLAVLGDVGSRALADLGRLVGLIDAGVLGAVGADEPTDLDGRLAALASRIGQTGTQVTLEVSGSPVAPEAAQVCYRVVQEALTNVVRHAPGSAVEVIVESTDAGCRISVVDDGGQPSTVSGHGTGFGLVGATERVRAVGGEFQAGPEPGRGWAVRAWLPARVESTAAAVGTAS
ncbi:MAG: histidine kinase [Microlunatus sp.]